MSPLSKLVDIVRDHQRVDLTGLDESLFDRIAHEDQQVVEEAVHVQDAAGLVVDPELRPRDGLHELLVGPEPAGQHDEGIRELGHERLALVHGAHHMQVAEGAMGDFVAGQRLGDHARRSSTRRQCRIGHHSHEAHRGTAVDKLDAAFGDSGPETPGCRGEGRVSP